jgi:hypothetical protein
MSDDTPTRTNKSKKKSHVWNQTPSPNRNKGSGNNTTSTEMEQKHTSVDQKKNRSKAKSRTNAFMTTLQGATNFNVAKAVPIDEVVPTVIFNDLVIAYNRLMAENRSSSARVLQQTKANLDNRISQYHKEVAQLKTRKKNFVKEEKAYVVQVQELTHLVLLKDQAIVAANVNITDLEAQVIQLQSTISDGPALSFTDDEAVQPSVQLARSLNVIVQGMHSNERRVAQEMREEFQAFGAQMLAAAVDVPAFDVQFTGQEEHTFQYLIRMKEYLGMYKCDLWGEEVSVDIGNNLLRRVIRIHLWL